LKERCNLRIRHDLVFVSCVLFTIALVCLIPGVWNLVLAGYCGIERLHGMDRAYAHSVSDVGKLTLALVIIGLIVTWTGYLNKVRWTWFVMFILVACLAIPIGILPLIVHSRLLVGAASDLILEAIGKKPATTPWIFWRSLFETISIFLLMVVALFLPVKSFFFERTDPTM